MNVNIMLLSYIFAVFFANFSRAEDTLMLIFTFFACLFFNSINNKQKNYVGTDILRRSVLQDENDFSKAQWTSRAELTNEWGLPSNQRLHITSGIAVLVEGSSWWITDANIRKVEGFVMKSKSKHHGQWKRRICEGCSIHFSKYIWTTKCINASFIPASLLVRCCNNLLHISMYYRLGLAST